MYSNVCEENSEDAEKNMKKKPTTMIVMKVVVKKLVSC